MKALNGSFPVIAVIVTAYYGLTFGAIVLLAQIAGGALTDLSFFSALDYKRPDNGQL